MVSDVTLSGAVLDQQQTQASSDALASDFSDFLNLLTVQLQNQDPLSPMETNEFTNQLVAFTGVEQQINTNQKLDSLIATSLGSGFSSALNYVGKDASYVSSEFYNDGQSPSLIKYALNDNAIDATIRVLDQNGTVVYEEDAVTSTGSHDFVWDGRDSFGNQLEAGTYEVVVDALDIDGNGVGSTTVVQGFISGVETQDGVIFAIIGDRAVAVGNILNVKVPQSETSTSSGDETDDSSAANDDSGSNDNTNNNNA